MRGNVFVNPGRHAASRPRSRITELSDRPGAIAAVVFGLYMVASVIAYWHLWPHLATYQAQAGNGDPASADWYLGWDSWSVLHLHNPFVTRVVNYPDGVNMVSNTSMPILGILMIPITSIWGPVLSYNLLEVLAMPLSACGGYLLARRFIGWRPAAFVAGLLYGFCPYLVAHNTEHLNLVFVPLPPLIMLVLYDLLIEPRENRLCRGALLGAMLAAQFLISSEAFATTVMFSALALIVVFVRAPERFRHGREHLAQAWRALALGAIIVVVVLAWPVYENFFGLQHVKGAPDDWFAFHSSLAAAILPTPQDLFGTAHLKQLGAQATPINNDGPYLGVPLVVTLVLASVLVRRRAARLLGLLVLIVFVLSMGTRFSVGLKRFATFGRHVPLPGVLVHDTPIINGAYPGRYSLFVALFASLLLAMAVDGLRRRPWRRPGWGRATALGLAVICLLPLVPQWPFMGIGPVGVPSYFTSAAVDAIPPASVALVYPFDDQGGLAYAELWQAEASFRFRMVDGSFLLPSAHGGIAYARSSLTQRTLDAVWAGPAPAMTPTLRSGLQAELQTWQVSTVLVRPDAYAGAFFEWLVGRPPDSEAGGVMAWYGVTWKEPPRP